MRNEYTRRYKVFAESSFNKTVEPFIIPQYCYAIKPYTWEDTFYFPTKSVAEFWADYVYKNFKLLTEIHTHSKSMHDRSEITEYSIRIFTPRALQMRYRSYNEDEQKCINWIKYQMSAQEKESGRHE